MTKDYYDILNRRKPIDRAADAFTGAADQMRPTNNAQRQEANMLRGFGAGLGMSGDFVREQKLKEIEDQAKELSTLDYELKMSSGQNKVRQEKLIGFYNNYRSDLQMANDYLKNGDYDALDMLIPTLSAGYEKATGNKIGKFVGSYNGVVTFDVGGGNYQTMSIKDMMNPLMDVIPENERGSYDAFMNTYQKKDFEIMRQSKQATLDHLLEQNAQLRANTKQLNAHAKVYEAEANPDSLVNQIKKEDLRNKIASTDKILKETEFVGKEKGNLDKTYVSNIKFLETYDKDVTTKKAALGAYKNIDKLLTEENRELWNRSGSGFISKAQRFLNPSNTESSRRQAQIEMQKEPLYRQIKDIFVGVVSDNDLALFVTTLPNLNNPYEANKNIIDQRVDQLETDIFKLENTKKLLEENNYSIHHTHSSIEDKVNQLNNERLENIKNEKEKIKLDKQNKVKILIPDGTTKIINVNELDKYIKNGAIKL